MAAGKKQKASVSINLIRILLKYLTKCGIDCDAPCKDARIDALILKDHEARISTKRFDIIWKEAVKKADDINFGLHFGREIANSYLGGNILFSMMTNSATVGNALEIFCRYHTLMEDAILPKMKVEDDFAFLLWEPIDPHFEISRQISEALLCAYVYIIRHITENNSGLVEVRFRHSRPKDIREHKEVFLVPLLFDQPKNELVLEKNTLNLPVFLADPILLETLERLAKKLLDRLYPTNIWTDKVISLISKLLAGGEKTDIKTIAANLAVSARNLQNRLKEEKTSYQIILDQVRKEVALNYLNQKDVTICDIAFLLGFSEQSAFNHAFKRWSGLTPGHYRKSV